MAISPQKPLMNFGEYDYSISMWGQIFYFGFFGLFVGLPVLLPLIASEDVDYVFLFSMITVNFLGIISAVRGVNVESNGLRIKYLIVREKFVAWEDINQVKFAPLTSRRAPYLIVKSKPLSFAIFIGKFTGIKNPEELIEKIIEKAGLVQVYESWWRGTKFEAEKNR